MKCPIDGHDLELVEGDHEQHKHPHLKHEVGEVFQCTRPTDPHRFHAHFREGQRFLKEDATGKDYADEMFDIPATPKHAK